ncbi:MAG: hypothetical protein WD512_18380, partial [Candidatus Paceibacterota bacterium]
MIKDSLPTEIILSKSKRPLKNPFTGGSVAISKIKSKKGARIEADTDIFKQLLMIYEIDDQNPRKLNLRDTPTHVTYKTKDNKIRNTPINSPKYKELMRNNDLMLFNGAFVDVVKNYTVNKLFGGEAQRITISPDEKIPIHSDHEDEIIELFREYLFNNVNTPNMISINAYVLAEGAGDGGNNYLTTMSFLEFDFRDNWDDFIQKVKQAIASFARIHAPNHEYVYQLDHFDILVFPLNSAGGCIPEDQDQNDRYRFSEDGQKFVSYSKANSNDCLLAACKRVSSVFKAKSGPKSIKTKYADIRKELKIDGNGPIDHYSIEKLGIPDYFKLTIKVNHFDGGQTFTYGNYPDEIYLKLRDGHYYHMVGVKQTNTETCMNSLRHNRAENNSDHDYQPKATLILKDPIDMKWVVCVDHTSLYNDNKLIKWFHNNISHEGDITSFIEYIANLENRLIKDDNRLYKSVVIGHTQNKKIIIHCFNGSTELFKNIKCVLNSNGTRTHEFNKGDSYILLKWGECLCFDLTCVFDASYDELLSDTAIIPGTEHEYAKLFDVIQSDFFFEFNVHIYQFVTLPSLGQVIWAATTRFDKDQLIYDLDNDQSNFISSANLGARNHPLKKIYKSEFFDELVRLENDEERRELLKTVKDTKQ